MIAYVREPWVTQPVGCLEHRAGVWLETRHRSRSRRCDLDDCEPAQEYLPFSIRRCALGCRTHRIAAHCRCDRVDVACRSSGTSERLVGARRRTHDYRPGHWCTEASIGKNAHVHLHQHSHDGLSHTHIHFHESETRHQPALNSQHSHAVSHLGWKPVLIGMMHGLAGSGALMLLVLTEI